MRWQGNRESDNVVDDRGNGGGGGFNFGGGRGIGLGSVAIALIAGWVFGINPLTVLGLLNGGGSAPSTTQPTARQAPAARPPPADVQARFVSVVLASTEEVWTVKLRQKGIAYQAPKLHIFRGSENTACGLGQSAMGPFYCPGDQNVYIDLGFFDELKTRFGAPGDFARGYVVAHEVGHHVQNLMGITAKVDAMRGRVSEARQNALSVRVELQADCYAGVWGHDAEQSKQWLDAGDLDSALNAASQIGDDTLQRESRGQVVPDSFTHGTSAQRATWFKRGFDSGSVEQCDTFGAKTL